MIRCDFRLATFSGWLISTSAELAKSAVARAQQGEMLSQMDETL